MIFARKYLSQLSFREGARVNRVWLSLLTFGLCTMGMSPHVCQGHIYKDGYVERSLAITVRGETGHGKLLIGLNEKTAASILTEAIRAKAKSELRSNKSGDENPLVAKPFNRQRGVVGNEKSDRKKRDTNAFDRPKQSVPKNSAQLGRDQAKAPRSGEGQHLTNPAMVDRLAALKEHWILCHLNLTLDGQQIDLKNISVSPAPRHPYSMVVKFDFDLQATEPLAAPDHPSNALNLRLVDETFPKQSGAVRYSLRTRGSTILLKTNVAPVIVRAQRFEFEKTRAKINSNSFTIDAKLIVDR